MSSHGHQLRAASQRIHGAALDERLNDPLVEQVQIDLLAELEDRREFTDRLARRHDRLDCVVTHILHGSQAEADRFSMRREVRVAHIDVGRLDRNAHLATLVDVLHYVVGAARDGRQQRGHKLDRIMRLQIRRLISQQRISGGVRLVETVAGELLHQIKKLLDFLLRKAALDRASHEPVALFGHRVGVLLAHGAAQQVGLTQRISRQACGQSASPVPDKR